MQALLVVTGHFVPWVELHVFMFGGMMISAIVGYLYGMDSARGWGPSAFGGALAGGTCEIIGIALAVVFHQTPMIALLVGTAICLLTGTVGGLFGQMAANMKKLI